jgi:hypothetical protein
MRWPRMWSIDSGPAPVSDKANSTSVYSNGYSLLRCIQNQPEEADSTTVMDRNS